MSTIYTPKMIFDAISQNMDKFGDIHSELLEGDHLAYPEIKDRQQKMIDVWDRHFPNGLLDFYLISRSGATNLHINQKSIEKNYSLLNSTVSCCSAFINCLHINQYVFYLAYSKKNNFHRVEIYNITGKFVSYLGKFIENKNLDISDDILTWAEDDILKLKLEI